MLIDPIISQKVAQAHQLMSHSQTHAWLIFGQEAPGPDPIYPLLMGDRDLGGGFLLLLHTPKTQKSLAIVNGLDSALPASTGVWESLIYKNNPYDALLETLQAANPATIALNYSPNQPAVDGLPHGRYQQLLSRFENTPFANRFISAEPIAMTLRTCKTSAEIEAIRQAIIQTDVVIDRLLAYMKPKMTGRELFDFLQSQIRSMGLGFGWSSYNNPILTVGPVPFMGHTPPDNTIWEKGQLLQIDIGVRYNGYCSDFQRMFYALKDGEDTAPPPVQALFQLVHRGIGDMINAIAPGVRNDYPSSIAFNQITAAGFPEPQYTAGHTLGRMVHDGGVGLPHFRNPRHSVMREGNVFTVEGLETRLEGYGWMSLEEDVAVTTDGVEILTKRQNELHLIK